MMSDPPRPPLRKAPSIGTRLTQDKSLELYRDARAFVSKHLREDDPDRAFTARLALRPYIVLASNRLVGEFLRRPRDQDHFRNGLKDFFFGLFGHSILFAEGAEAAELRQLILPLFDADSVNSYEAVLKEMTSHWMAECFIPSDKVQESLLVYHQFKELSLAMNLKLFLGVDAIKQPELFKSVSELATNHWHGIISVPLSIKLVMSSSYRKAVDAKDALLALIRQRLRTGEVDFLTRFKTTSKMDEDLLVNHVLVFVCALIPKAAASILTSLVDTSPLWFEKYVDEVSQDISEEDLTAVLLEVMRLYPPFVGSLRVAETDATVGDFLVPKGHGVFCVTMMAQVDPQTFPYPDRFLPERWKTYNRDDRDKLFCFGAGVHGCVGERFMWRFLLEVAGHFIRSFTWDTSGLEASNRKMKYLPVARPAVLEPLVLRRRKTGQ